MYRERNYEIQMRQYIFFYTADYVSIIFHSVKSGSQGGATE